MAKVTFDTMLDEVNCRMGNVVYSEWKGIKYARKYKKPKNANTEQQKLIREAFSRTSNIWKPLPDSMKDLWEKQAKGKPLTGFNLFFIANFEKARDNRVLDLLTGTGIDALKNLTGSISVNGTISVSFDPAPAGQNAAVFIQKVGETDKKLMLIKESDVAGASMPLTFAGFDSASSYFVYAVYTDAGINVSTKVSDSAGCEVAHIN